MDNQFELLSKLVQRSSVTVDFEDLCYTVQNGRKQILRNVSGSFRAGELTVILGPSGSGKTTLLNILAGYVTAGVAGQIKINERPRKMKQFHKLSTYIMQEDLLQTNLTVEESMMVAIDLKLGAELFESYRGHELRKPHAIKMKLIDEVLVGLGLSNCRHIRTENLSGGQKRRLSIALELTNNPPVIFLDEPTTGLDIVAIKQCVRLLQFLARQGRTVICTIHQPTASMFELFDQVYFIANGYSIFNGDPLKLVPFLASENLQCPTTYNPADYLLELVQNSEIDIIRKLQNRNQNGALTQFRKNQSNRSLASTVDNLDSIEISHNGSEKCHNSPFPTTFRTQFRILSKRMFLQSLRNKQILFLQFFHHVISALLIGCAFYGIGNNANNALLNFKFCLSVVVFFMYTHIMIPVLLFPMEFKLLRREYFNRWYGLKAFYFARTLSSIPSLVLFGAMFTTITYLLTYQPLELYRYGMFLFFATMISICSEGLGIAVGSMFSITNGSIVGPASITPLLALCTYGIGYGQSIEPLMRFLMALSYLRYGLVGFLQALYGSDRAILDCNYNEDLYCHYRNPKTILRDLGMDNQSVTGQITGLFLILLFYRILAYCFLRYRLTAEFSRKIYYYATKIFQH